MCYAPAGAAWIAVIILSRGAPSDTQDHLRPARCRRVVELDRDLRAALVYLAHVRNFAGINGLSDFEKYPQRGLGPETALITEWNPGVKTWVVVSQPGGKPFG